MQLVRNLGFVALFAFVGVLLYVFLFPQKSILDTWSSQLLWHRPSTFDSRLVLNPCESGRLCIAYRPIEAMLNRAEVSINPVALSKTEVQDIKSVALCESLEGSSPGRQVFGRRNPRICGDNDCYDIVVISAQLTDGSYKLKGQKYVVEVSQPKTSSAKIVAVRPLHAPVETKLKLSANDQILSVHMTADSRLLTVNSKLKGLLYSYHSADSKYDLCDVRSHTEFNSFIEASGKPAMKSYGVFHFDFRDLENQKLQTNIYAQSHWLDRHGGNLFIISNQQPAALQIAGLWTFGKFVQVDKDISMGSMSSPENQLMYYDEFKPSSPSDVVWRFFVGEKSFELSFDDWLNAHSLVIAPMLISDGKVINNSTNLSGVSQGGAVSGAYSTVAGFSGQAIQLDSSSSILFKNLNSGAIKNLYLGLLFQARDAQLLELSNALQLKIQNKELLLSGKPLVELTNPQTKWNHLGLLIESSSSQHKYTVYLNGSEIKEWITDNQSWLQEPLEWVKLGGAGELSIDEFKLLTTSLNDEEVCNQAFGTLSLQGGEKYCQTPMVAVGDKECLNNLRKAGFNKEKCIRGRELFPEGPLLVGQPRPDSTSNQFCLSCHTQSHSFHTMNSNLALFKKPVKFEKEFRRQPMQPPPVLFGHFPRGFLGLSEPQAKTFGVELDPLLQQRRGHIDPR